MRERLTERLGQLRKEFDSGKVLLADLETRHASLRDTLLRIGGAIQVLEAALAEPVDRPAGVAPAAEGLRVVSGA